MKKVILIFATFFLLISTTLIKNATKEIEEKIYSKNENISELKTKYDLVLLDYNYLSSPNRLIKLQKELFNVQFVNYDLDKIKKIIFFNEMILFQTDKM